MAIADRKHKLLVCRADDVVIDGAEIRLEKSGIYAGWAAIKAKKPSTYVPQGVTVGEPVDKPTHVITMNFRSDVEITSAAWLYEARLKSPPRWFKILSLVEGCDYFEFHCRLTERSDIAPVPSNTGFAKVTI